jgi:hypothetical protein
MCCMAILSYGSLEREEPWTLQWRVVRITLTRDYAYGCDGKAYLCEGRLLGDRIRGGAVEHVAGVMWSEMSLA